MRILKRTALYFAVAIPAVIAVAFVAAALDPSPPVLAGIFALTGVTLGYTSALVLR